MNKRQDRLLAQRFNDKRRDLRVLPKWAQRRIQRAELKVAEHRRIPAENRRLVDHVEELASLHGKYQRLGFSEWEDRRDDAIRAVRHLVSRPVRERIDQHLATRAEEKNRMQR